MESALRNRLTFGPMMLAGLFLLLLLDWQVGNGTRHWAAFHRFTGVPGEVGLQGVGILILLMLILPIATAELAVLFTAEHVRPYRLLSAAGSGALAVHAFLTQFPVFQAIAASTLAFIVAFVMI